MILWIFIILALGIFLLFGSEAIIKNDWIRQIGMAITLICIGISCRMIALRRRGGKERLFEKVKELETELESLKSSQSREGEKE
ncbi:MAG: hypothetical protein WC049_08830 [Candidatus Ratteibacteria bacterium]